MGGKRISTKTKLKVLKLLKQGFRSQYIANRLHMHRSTVEQWVYLFDGGNESWVYESYSHRYSFMSEKEKQEIVGCVLDLEISKAGACTKYKISRNVLNKWICNYNNHGITTLKKGRPAKRGCNDGRGKEEDEGARKGERRTEAGRRLLEDILPHLRGKRDGSSKKNVLQAVAEGQRLGIPAERSLKEVGVASSTYYYWLSHKDSKKEEDEALAAAIREIQEDSYWAYGALRMTEALKQSGRYESINHKRVERVMREYKLNAKVRRRRFPKNYYMMMKDNGPEFPGNVLARDFSADGPLQKLVTDITYLPTEEGWCYMAAIKDLYNNEIVARKVSRNQTLGLVIDVVKQLKNRAGSLRGCLLHSDMGWTYTNARYVKFLKELGIVQSLSRKGNCWDNACMENFFGHMKSETIYQSGKNNRGYKFNEIRKIVYDYVTWYNEVRISKKLRYQSPVQYRKSTA